MHIRSIIPLCLIPALAACAQAQATDDAMDWNHINYAAITCPTCKTPDPGLNSIGAGKR